MKLIDNTSVVHGDIGKTTDMKLQSSVKMFDILDRRLYKYKPRAVLREYGTNAVDVHVEVGIDTPFDVHLPTDLEPYVIIRDYGTGLTEDEMIRYATYGLSTKENNNDAIGALGLGTKSAFSYSNTFSLTSYINGVEIVYNFFKSGGEPKYDKVFERETNEPNGLKVYVPVQPEDIDTFIREARYVYYTFEKIKPNIVNMDLDLNYISYDNFGMFVDNDNKNGNIYAVMGGVRYPIHVSEIDIDKKPLSFNMFYGKRDVYIRFEIGEIDFVAGREELSYDPFTVNAIRQRFESFSEHYISTLQSLINECKTIDEAFQVANDNHRFMFSGWHKIKYNNMSMQTVIEMYTKLMDRVVDELFDSGDIRRPLKKQEEVYATMLYSLESGTSSNYNINVKTKNYLVNALETAAHTTFLSKHKTFEHPNRSNMKFQIFVEYEQGFEKYTRSMIVDGLKLYIPENHSNYDYGQPVIFARYPIAKSLAAIDKNGSIFITRDMLDTLGNLGKEFRKRNKKKNNKAKHESLPAPSNKETRPTVHNALKMDYTGGAAYYRYGNLESSGEGHTRQYWTSEDIEKLTNNDYYICQINNCHCENDFETNKSSDFRRILFNNSYNSRDEIATLAGFLNSKGKNIYSIRKAVYNRVINTNAKQLDEIVILDTVASIIKFKPYAMTYHQSIERILYDYGLIKKNYTDGKNHNKVISLFTSVFGNLDNIKASSNYFTCGENSGDTKNIEKISPKEYKSFMKKCSGKSGDFNINYSKIISNVYGKHGSTNVFSVISNLVYKWDQKLADALTRYFEAIQTNIIDRYNNGDKSIIEQYSDNKFMYHYINEHESDDIDEYKNELKFMFYNYKG